MHCFFMCALVYNMMCVECCVHLCMIGYIWKTKNTRVREHDHRCSGTTIYQWLASCTNDICHNKSKIGVDG